MNFLEKITNTVNESIATKHKLLEVASNDILHCGNVLSRAMQNGKKVLFCGNGGSAADSQHLAAELVVRLRSKINRRALPALALTVDPSIMTAGGNDIGYDNVFARGVEAYGNDGDVLIAISTSGNSENVIRAVNQAHSQGVVTIGLLGGSGGKMANLCNHNVTVPSDVTARIQESHIMIGHIWCEMIEETLFPELF